MKESYGEGPATHAAPESCGVSREGTFEALTGARPGQVFSRETTFLRGADAVRRSGRQDRLHRYREMQQDPARSETLRTFGNTSHENREIQCSPAADGTAGRIGKSKDTRR
jgi:hypothetical protein